MADNEGHPDDLDRIAQQSEALKDNWEKTLHDMNAMAQDREERGWETLTIPAGDTAPQPPSAGEDDKFGLVHVIPGNKADRFTELYEVGQFPETGIYQMTNAGHVFMVSEHIDPDYEVVIYIAAQYDMRHAPELVRTATDRGKMYTHVRKLDKTFLGTFEHDDVSAFFPDPEAFYAYEMDY